MISLSLRQRYTVSGGILQFAGESFPRSWSRKRLYRIPPYLDEDSSVASPGVKGLSFTFQRARFPSDSSARFRHVLVDEHIRSFQLSCVTHDICLHVVRCKPYDDVTGCRSVLRPLSHAMGTDHVAVFDFYVKRSGCKIFHEPVGVFVRRLRQSANLHSVETGVLLQLVASSSRLTTLTRKSLIWVSFFAIVSLSDFVIVTASPRRSWAKASVVTGPLVSRDEIVCVHRSTSTLSDGRGM